MTSQMQGEQVSPAPMAAPIQPARVSPQSAPAKTQAATVAAKVPAHVVISQTLQPTPSHSANWVSPTFAKAVLRIRFSISIRLSGLDKPDADTARKQANRVRKVFMLS